MIGGKSDTKVLQINGIGGASAIGEIAEGVRDQSMSYSVDEMNI